MADTIDKQIKDRALNIISEETEERLSLLKGTDWKLNYYDCDRSIQAHKGEICFWVTKHYTPDRDGYAGYKVISLDHMKEILRRFDGRSIP